jgi:adenylate cyclase
MKQIREQEREFVRVVSEVSAEIKLGLLLKRVMGEATRMLNAERSTLFLHDDKTDELWSEVGEGPRIEPDPPAEPPRHRRARCTPPARSINIPHAYADLRFNPNFDTQHRFFTRSILCVPIIHKNGRTIGVTQVLNKHGGPFSRRGRVAPARIHRADLDRAREREAVRRRAEHEELQRRDARVDVERRADAGRIGRIVTCNMPGLRILKMRVERIVNQMAADFFTGDNGWILEKLKRVEETGRPELTMDGEMMIYGGEHISTNLTALPLVNAEKQAHRLDGDHRGHQQRESASSRRWCATWIRALPTSCSRAARRRSAARAPRRPCSSPTSAASPTISEQLGPQGPSGC